jgi:hypothetical protein
LNCNNIKQWPLPQHSPDLHKSCANFVRRMSFFSKSALANVASLVSIKSRHSGEFGKCSKFGSVYKVGYFIYKSTYFAYIKWSSLPLPNLLVLAKLASTHQTRLTWVTKKQQEGFFGKCEYLQELDKTGKYLHLLNSRASSHCLNKIQYSKNLWSMCVINKNVSNLTRPLNVFHQNIFYSSSFLYD